MNKIHNIILSRARGEGYVSIAKRLGVGQSTISNAVKSESLLKAYASLNEQLWHLENQVDNQKLTIEAMQLLLGFGTALLMLAVTALFL